MEASTNITAHHLTNTDLELMVCSSIPGSIPTGEDATPITRPLSQQHLSPPSLIAEALLNDALVGHLANERKLDNGHPLYTLATKPRPGFKFCDCNKVLKSLPLLQPSIHIGPTEDEEYDQYHWPSDRVDERTLFFIDEVVEIVNSYNNMHMLLTDGFDEDDSTLDLKQNQLIDHEEQRCKDIHRNAFAVIKHVERIWTELSTHDSRREIQLQHSEELMPLIKKKLQNLIRNAMITHIEGWIEYEHKHGHIWMLLKEDDDTESEVDTTGWDQAPKFIPHGCILEQVLGYQASE